MPDSSHELSARFEDRPHFEACGARQVPSVPSKKQKHCGLLGHQPAFLNPPLGAGMEVERLPKYCPGGFGLSGVAAWFRSAVSPMTPEEVQRAGVIALVGSHFIVSRRIEVVEAGGVEPPSEKVRSEEPTCVAGSGISAVRSRANKMAAT
jgi:hypothetical protein